MHEPLNRAFPFRRAARRAAGLLLAAWTMLAAVPATATDAAGPPTPFDAHVVRVHDGDSLVVRRIGETRSRRVRLSGIDAPERTQTYGDAAREALTAWIGDSKVRVLPVKRDVYGRLVAAIEIDGRDAGLAMVEAGHAWYFRRYRRDVPVAMRRAYERAEARAREAGVGLWAEAGAEPPWRYRARGRDQRAAMAGRWRLSPS